MGAGGCHGHPACGHLGGCDQSPDGHGQPSGPDRGSSVLEAGWDTDGVEDKG